MREVDGAVDYASAPKPKIDPLHRVFVYNGSKFKTSDNTVYVRPQSHVDTIRRATPKVRGKAARAADKKARRATR